MHRARPSCLLPLALAALILPSCAPPATVEATRPPLAAAGPTSSPSPSATVSPDASRGAQTPRPSPVPTTESRASAALEAFAIDVYKELAGKPDNFVFSPFSVARGLAMARAGAAGKTADEMDRVLHAGLAVDLDEGLSALDRALARKRDRFPVESGPLELRTADQLWAQRGMPFEKPFLDRLSMHYGSGAKVVDYVNATEQARSEINRWVAERTRERVPQLIPAGVLDRLTRLVLTNAVYLKAEWLQDFKVEATRSAPFRRLDGSTVQAQLMRAESNYLYGSGTDHQAIRLPYFGGLSMVIVVPEHGRFNDVERGLTAGALARIAAGFELTYVKLGMPKFAFRTQADMNAVLKVLGMPTAFDPTRADFSAMTTAEKLYITAVLHQAFISVDEKGTEAAAATSFVSGGLGGPSRIAELTIDRPFLFFIQDDETGAILFLGRVLDPS